MHTLDGHQISLGDNVFDVALGPGVVKLLTDAGGVTVEFGRGRVGSYGPGGVARRFNNRTLYWHNPVVVAPDKGISQWNILRDATTALAQSLRSNGVGI